MNRELFPSIELLPLHAMQLCPGEGEYKPHAAILDDVNRNILVCLSCGMTYVLLGGTEDDELRQIGGYVYCKSMWLAGVLEVCHVG